MRAAIFDLDGTLVDSNEFHVLAWQETFRHFGKEIPLERLREQIGKGGDQYLPVFLTEREMREIGEEADKFRGEVFKKKYLPQVKPFPKVRELFEQAAAFAPSYYHFYREYANFLLPKWYGEEGETQAFAEEVAKRAPEPDGYIIYFEIASLLACQCDKERDSLVGMSWPKVKRGYEELQGRYGNSKLKMNRFAYMSFVADDKATAQGAFAALGDSWDETVWRNAANFQAAKKWALSQ